MGKPKPDDVVKDIGANLDSWYKKNEKRVKLLDDLTLDCDLCKSKEAKEAIETMRDRELKTLKGDLDSFGKQSKKLFESLEKDEQKGIDKRVKDLIEKKTTIFNKNGVKVRIKPTYTDGVPGLSVEGDF